MRQLPGTLQHIGAEAPEFVPAAAPAPWMASLDCSAQLVDGMGRRPPSGNSAANTVIQTCATPLFVAGASVISMANGPRNGRQGTILGCHAASQRYQVQLVGGRVLHLLQSCIEAVVPSVGQQMPVQTSFRGNYDPPSVALVPRKDRREELPPLYEFFAPADESDTEPVGSDSLYISVEGCERLGPSKQVGGSPGDPSGSSSPQLAVEVAPSLATTHHGCAQQLPALETVLVQQTAQPDCQCCLFWH